MPGPKPMSPEAYAARRSEGFNFSLLKVLGPRKFKVKCLTCSVVRECEAKNGGFGPRCVCTHKRPFYRIKRTTETHTKEILDKGIKGYSCTVIGKGSKSKNTYVHECGNVFRMSKDCFFGCGEPCEVCRQVGISHTDYVKRLRKITKAVELVGTYTDSRIPIKFKYLKCGHVINRIPFVTFRKRERSYKCPICEPNRCWFRTKIAGKVFRTRSMVEREFIKKLVASGISVDDIHYEPKEGKVPYFNPVTGKPSTYTPDFRIKSTYVEIKDLASLGLAEYHWKDKDEALIENRAKCKAALKQLGKFRTYVRIKGKFYETREYWKSTEQKRLHLLNKTN